MTRHRVVYAALIVALLLPAVARAQTPAAAPGSGPTYEQAKLRLDQVMQGVTQLAGQLDRTQFDLDALAVKLGFDAQDAVAFVHDQIAFEQYPGLLRGARGTLLSRAGNALDQAVLLATLLDKQGIQTRIARATLSPEQAQALVNQMAAPRPPAPPPGDAAQIEATLTQIMQSAGAGDQEIAAQVRQALNPPPVTETAAFKAVQTDTAFVLKTVENAGVHIGDPNAMPALVAEARDYFWVEYRADAASPWTAAHPAFKDAAAAPEDLKPATTYDDVQSLPGDLSPQFGLEVTIERSVQGKLTTEPVLTVPPKPVADLANNPMTLTNVSNGIFKAGASGEVGKILAQSTLFVPQFGDTFDPSAHAFDLNGTIYELSQVKPGEFSASPLPGESAGGAIEGAAGAFGTAPATAAPAAAGALTAVWVDYTLTAPDGTTTTTRRVVLDRVGPDNRAANRPPPATPADLLAAKVALLQHQTFMLATGAYPQGYVLDRQIARLNDSRPLLDAILQQKYRPDQPVGLPADLLTKLGSAWPGLAPLYAIFDAVRAATPDTVIYRAAPSLAIYWEGITPPPSGSHQWGVRNAVDIVGNPRRVFDVSDGKLAPAPSDLVRVGVWETHAENDAVPNPAGTPRFNTMRALEQAAAASIPLRVVASADALAASGVKLDPAGMANLKLDLANGYVVMVPQAMPANAPLTGWWRLNPQTGETLGMTSDGRGQSMADYALLASVACAGYGGFTGWSAIATAANCGGLVGGYALGVLGASPMMGMVFAAIIMVAGNELDKAYK